MTRKRLINLLIAVSLAMMPSFLSTSEASAASCTLYHLVQAGEDLGSISVRYGVPWSTIAYLNQLPYPGVIYVGQQLCIAISDTALPGSAPPIGGYYPVPYYYPSYAPPPAPYVPPVYYAPAVDRSFSFRIADVQKNESVTIEVRNYHAGETFHVRMGPIGTRAVNGIYVGSFSSSRSGSLLATYIIPWELRGFKSIAIRMDSASTGRYYYNWFYNTTGYSYGYEKTSSKTSSSYAISFKVTNVVPDKKVTIRVLSAPENDTLRVYLGKIGMGGGGGVQVGKIKTGKDGAFYATFQIPKSLQDVNKIAIRLESRNSGAYALSWFYNK